MPIKQRSNNMLGTLPTFHMRGCKKALKVPNGSEEKEINDAEQEHEIHILTERERRKKMRNMFAELHALLPQLPAKVDKVTIVDEAVNYIKVLELTLQNLQQKKLQMMHRSTMIDYNRSQVVPPTLISDSREAYRADQISVMDSNQGLLVSRLPTCVKTWSTPNVVFSVNDNDAQICICTVKKPGLLPMLFYILEKNNINVVSAQISSDHFRSMLMIHAHAKGVSSENEEISMLDVDRSYKSAAGEIEVLLSS